MTIRIFACVALLLLATLVFAQQPATPSPMTPSQQPQDAAGVQPGVVTNVGDAKFTTIPGLPDCTTGAVQHGDPMSGAFVILAKASERCSIPMHYHTANEQLMIVNGSGQIQMQGEQPQTVSSGGYVYLPAKHGHQLTCPSGCMLYVTSDAAFDIHYIDQSGAEISPERALSAVGERVAVMPQR